MPVGTTGGTKAWHRYTPMTSLAILFGWLLALGLFVFCSRLISEKTQWMFVWGEGPIDGAFDQAVDIGQRMVPPNVAYLDDLWQPLWDTINIATLGTLMALVIAVPVAFCAARNTTPSVRFVRPVALFIIVSSRSINSLIWALALVQIFGPGVFAGIIAIGLRSIGFVAKLLYESIEEIDHNQVEAVTATGASGPQVLSYGIVPQIMPAFAGISVFRWDINIRESTIVGYVGAGGIGVQLSAQIANLAWTNVAVILLAILFTVIISEWVSAKVRHAII